METATADSGISESGNSEIKSGMRYVIIYFGAFLL